MKIMTTIIMRASDDNRGQLFLALFQGFQFLGNLPISLVFHEAPTGTRHGKVQYPLWFHDVPHGWGRSIRPAARLHGGQ